MRPTKSVIAVVLLGLSVAACGSGSKSTSSGAAPPAPSTQASTTATIAGSGRTGTIAAVSTGPVRATLRGASHDPVVNRNWVYVVTASDASGHPLSGTVDSEFVYSGHVVGRETPPIHPLKGGRVHDVIQFPAAAVGVPLTFQAVVHTPPGTVTLDWPVKVKR